MSSTHSLGSGFTSVRNNSQKAKSIVQDSWRTLKSHVALMKKLDNTEHDSDPDPDCVVLSGYALESGASGSLNLAGRACFDLGGGEVLGADLRTTKPSESTTSGSVCDEFSLNILSGTPLFEHTIVQDGMNGDSVLIEGVFADNARPWGKRNGSLSHASVVKKSSKEDRRVESPSTQFQPRFYDAESEGYDYNPASTWRMSG